MKIQFDFYGLLLDVGMIPITPDDKMNKLERKYADMLDLLKRSGEIIDYVYHPFGFKLADKTYYHPDFLVVYQDRFEIHETKGYLRDDASVKIKVASKMFPWFKFRMIYWKKGWIEINY